MEILKEKLGEELYNCLANKLDRQLISQISKKLQGLKFVINSGPMIPKQRFDCVNLCLKDAKKELADCIEKKDKLIKKTKRLVAALIESKVETALVRHSALDIKAVKALIDFSKLKPEGGGIPEIECKIEEQIVSIKKSKGFLFESTDFIYLLCL